jgi:hypothetical protein
MTEIINTDKKLSTGEFCKVIIDEKTKDLTDYYVRNFIDKDGKMNLVIIDRTKMEASIWQIARNPLSPTGFSVTHCPSVKAHCSSTNVLKPKL